jgi:hypothetical protein
MLNRLVIDSTGGITATDAGCNVVWNIDSGSARVAAGMLNVYRAVARISTPVGYRRPGEDGVGTRGAKDAWDDDEN